MREQDHDRSPPDLGARVDGEAPPNALDFHWRVAGVEVVERRSGSCWELDGSSTKGALK
jgi:hypothetical protein